MSKLDRLKEIIRPSAKAIVLFSGGADSSFLFKISVDLLGPENITALTAVSESYTSLELNIARKTAAETGAAHIVIKTDELANPEFSSNGPDRCYHCKKELFAKAVFIAGEKGIKDIFDGTNADDVSDYRPGRKAAAEFGIRSPLLEAGLTKGEIRKYSREMGLSTWNLPANPCLASRFPYGSHINAERLAVVGKAEAFLREHGFDIVRVRHHGPVARIEIPPARIAEFAAGPFNTQVSEYFRQLGFTWVSLDLDGYRAGSMNEVLKREE